jgi:glycosyltransferase involved in cell wall biosynthesis
MNDVDLVSVVLPVYNSGFTAIRAIDSIVAQRYLDIEVIIIDDGSTDDSLNLINTYVNSLENDLRITVVSQANGGVSAARNRGILESSGEFIAFLDSDDQWVEGKLQYQMDFMIENKDVAMSGTLTDIRPHNMFLRSKEFQYIVFWNQFISNNFQPSTVILRRAAIDEIGGFPINRRYAEEGDLFLRLTYSYKCVLFNKVLTKYGDGKESFGDSGLSGNVEMMWAGELLNAVACFERKHISSIFLVLFFVVSYIKFVRRILLSKFRIKK